MRNVQLSACVRIVDASLHPDALYRAPGQLLPVARRAYHNAILAAEPRFAEPRAVVSIVDPDEAVATSLRGFTVLRAEERLLEVELPLRAALALPEHSGQVLHAGWEALSAELSREKAAALRVRKGLDPLPATGPIGAPVFSTNVDD